MSFDDPATAVCVCNFCNNQLRFQPLRAGETINCPNCSMETVLRATDVPSHGPHGNHVISVQNVTWEISNLGIRHLTGEIINHSDRSLDWVRVEFILHDENSAMLGTASDFLSKLGVGQLWKFRASVHHKSTWSASLPILTCEHGQIQPVHDFAGDFIVWPSHPMPALKN